MKVEFESDGTARPEGLRAGDLVRILAHYPKDTVVLIEGGRIIGIEERESFARGTLQVELIRE